MIPYIGRSVVNRTSFRDGPLRALRLTNVPLSTSLLPTVNRDSGWVGGSYAPLFAEIKVRGFEPFTRVDSPE